MSLHFKIDVDEILKPFANIRAQLEMELVQSVKGLALMTHAKVAELASSRLKSTRKPYLDALSFIEVSPEVWVVSLDESANWIEEGKKPGSMIEDLLRKDYKIAKDGTKYRVIPFEHSKAPSQMSAKALEIVQVLRQNLKSQGIPWKGIERDQSGNPRLGALHRLNIASDYPSPKASFPALQGVTIYQNKTKTGNVRRDTMTFRIVSEKQIPDGKWNHPGTVAHKFFEVSLSWAESVWEHDVLPEVLSKAAGG